MKIRTRRLWIYRKKHASEEGHSYLISNKEWNAKRYPELELLYDFDVREDRLGEIYFAVLQHRDNENELRYKIGEIVNREN